MTKKCFLCGKVLKEKYFFTFNGIVYEIFPGFDDVFNLCNTCNQKRIEMLFDGFKAQEIEIKKILKTEGANLQISWREFYLLKRTISKSHRQEVWDLYSDLLDILIFLGFVTQQPVKHWMFIGGYNLVHYLGKCLYFKTEEDAVNFCRAEIETEPFKIRHPPKELIQINKMSEVRFD
jgi:hypothetical protein